MQRRSWLGSAAVAALLCGGCIVVAPAPEPASPRGTTPPPAAHRYRDEREWRIERERQAERERHAELERQAELRRQAEVQRQAEYARQLERERQEEERKRQERERRDERGRHTEQQRQDEHERQGEHPRQNDRQRQGEPQRQDEHQRPAPRPVVAAAQPQVLTYAATPGRVTFDHRQHAASQACNACHPTNPPAKVKLGKDKAHKLCMGCHKKQGAATACAGCHKAR